MTIADKRVLVTGARGFIGRWVVPALHSRGYTVYSTASAGARLGEAADSSEYHVVDLLDLVRTRALVAQLRPTHLLHLAWDVTPGLYWNSEQNFRWTIASLELVRAFIESGGTRITIAGTCAEYDWTKVGVCREYESPLASDGERVSAAYPTCKSALQKMVAALAAGSGVSNSWVRIFFQYGPFEHPSRLIPSTICNLLAGKDVLCTHGRQIRSFLHVADVAEAIVAVHDSDERGPFNIGSDERISIGEVVCWIADQLNRHDRVRLGARPTPPNEPDLLIPDVSRLQCSLGWRPRFRLQEGLSDTIAWWRGRYFASTEN